MDSEFRTSPTGSENPTAEEQVALLQRQLAQLQRLSSLGELLGTTTHEFNNILMTIMNYAKLGLRHQDQASRDKAFQKILDASNRAAKITQSVLGMARNRSDSLEPTDLKGLITDSLILLEREMRKYRIAVETDFHEVPLAMANGNQIQQVLLNLLINARQAMPDGGRILLRMEHDSQDGMVVLTIRDFGTGIPADKLPRIFDPYFSTKSGPDESGKGGTGLGLATCRGIIEAHQGRIRVESTVGQGTAFSLRIPACSTVPAPLGATGANVNDASNQPLSS